MNRSMVWVLVGLASMVTLAGCGRSLEGDYLARCKAICSAGDDCENISKYVVDLEECNHQCDVDSDNYASYVEKDCGVDYELLGDNTDRCVNSTNTLAQVCREDHKSDYNSALGNAVKDCNQEFYRCK